MISSIEILEMLQFPDLATRLGGRTEGLDSSDPHVLV
jgi:hypothetical protein